MEKNFPFVKQADFKAVAKSRKNLQKLCADMDSAKKKYEGLARQSTISTSESNATKITHAKAEYEDLVRQVDTQRVSGLLIVFVSYTLISFARLDS